MKRELWLLDSFLTSPLPKHPKSPTLWSHRRWLLTEHWKLIASLHDRDTEPEQTRRQDPGSRLLSRELHVVLKAAERHQHNYHAWNYLRKLVRQFISTDSSSPDIDTALRDCVEMVHSWCTQHPRDVSGWSFLLFLLRLAKDSELAGDIIELVAKRAISLQFGGEAVWGFIMHAVEREGFLDWGTTIEVLEAMKAYLGELQGKEARHGRTGRALSTEEKRLVRWIGRLQ